MKLIIYLDGNPSVSGYSLMEFKWSQPHGCFLYGGKELDEKDFNKTFAAAADQTTRSPWFRQRGLFPKVKIIESTIPTPEPKPLNHGLDSAPQEITVAQAEEAMERLAPHRLKKKTGPKPELVAV